MMDSHKTESFCLHPIEFSTMYDWISDEDTLVIIAKCRLCGSDCQVVIQRDHELIIKQY